MPARGALYREVARLTSADAAGVPLYQRVDFTRRGKRAFPCGVSPRVSSAFMRWLFGTALTQPGRLAWALVLIWPTLAPALDPARALSQYRLDRWTPREGLPVLSLLSVLQDRAGYLWLGTQEGLARFDGVAFRTFKLDDNPALGSNYISALFQDRGGRIWVGTESGQLSYFDGRALQAIAGGNVVRGQVAGFAESNDGGLFVAFRGAGLRRVEGERLEPVLDSEGRPIERLGALARGEAGELWAGGEGQLFRGLGGSWTRFELPRASGRLVTALAASPEGELVFSEDDRTVRRVRPKGLALDPVQPDWQLPAAVRTLLFDRDASLWVGSESGLARRRKEPAAGFELWRAGPLLAIDALHEDREGGLWIATHAQGLFRLRADEVVPFGAPEGLPDDATWNVLEASDGALWVTTNGGLARIVGQRVERVSVPGFPGEDAVTLTERRDGSLWVGTYRNGLFRLPRPSAPLARFTPSQGIPNGPLTVLFEDSRGALWVGSREGLVREKGGSFVPVRLVEGPLQPYVASIVEDRAGTVWIATNLGLFAHGPGGVRRYGDSEGLASTALNALLLDRDGQLWIATNGQGIQVMDAGRFWSVDRSQGLPTGLVLWLVEDAASGLWFSSNHGLFKADRQALLRAAKGATEQVEVRRFGVGDGMRGEECAGNGQPAGVRSRDGRVWFATGSGLVAVDPARLSEPSPPTPALEALVVDGQATTMQGATPLEVAPGRGDLEVRFTALGLDEATGTSFRYRLDGYDRAWIEAGQRRSAFYTHLAPGSYRFELQALHDDGGSWSAPTSLALQLRPQPYQTVWFRVLLGIVAGLALYGGIRLRSRRLEGLVRQRTTQLSQANQKLTRALEREAELHAQADAALRHADLARLEAERQEHKAQRASRAKGEFLASVSHELRTPLNGILGFSELLLDSNLDPRQREFTQIVQASGETLLALVNQILDLTQIDRGKLALVAEPFWVPDCFEEAVDLLAPAAAGKGLDLALSLETAACRTAIGDRTRLREIATNLLANAVKFTKSGGVLAELRARVQQGRLEVVLEVVDTGIGIAPENRARIFQPFDQVDASLARRHGGAGLGLAIASRLCSSMQGGLSVESELGSGSSFTATVQLDIGPDALGGPLEIQLDGRQVLLVGLSGQTCTALERQLRAWGGVPISVGAEGNPASTAGRGFAFGIVSAPASSPPGLEIPWIRLVSPATSAPDSPSATELLRPVRPGRLAAAIRAALGATVPSPQPVPTVSLAILIAEDNPVNQEVARALLDSLGYGADLVGSAEEALEALGAKRYDLLLLDIQMPGMDGFELARQIQARFGADRPRLVALTAAAMEGDRERCLEVGMDDYLTKPVSRAQIAAVLAVCAGGATRKS